MQFTSSQNVKAFLSSLGVEADETIDNYCLNIPDCGELYIDSLDGCVGVSLAHKFPEYLIDEFLEKSLTILHRGISYGVFTSMTVGLQGNNTWVAFSKLQETEASANRILEVAEELRRFYLEVKGTK